MDEITKVELMYYLQHPELEDVLWQEAKTIRNKLYTADERIKELEREYIETSQMAVRMSEVPKSRTNNQRDLFDVLEQTEKATRNHRRELTIRYTSLMEQIDEVRRVWLVYETLLPLEREIVKRLYMEHQKWEVVEKELGINHRILVKKVSDIFQTIKTGFSSGASNTELARQKNTMQLLERNRKKANKSKRKNVDHGQLNLSDFIET